MIRPKRVLRRSLIWRLAMFGLLALSLLAACRPDERDSGGQPVGTPRTATLVGPNPPSGPQFAASAAPVALNGVTGLVWLAQGQGLALAAPDGVALYQPLSAQAAPGAQAPAAPQALAAAQDASLLTSAQQQPTLAWVSAGRQVIVWDQQAAPRSLASASSPVTGLALDAAGERLAYITFAGELVQTSLNGSPLPAQAAPLSSPPAGAAPTPQPTFPPEALPAPAQAAPQALKAPAWLTNLSYSPDGRWLGGTDLTSFTVYILDAASGQTLRDLHWTDAPLASLYGAYFSPDWRWLAWVSQTQVLLMDVETGRPGERLTHADAVSALAWSPDGRWLATAAAVQDETGALSPAVLVWDAASGLLLDTLPQTAPVQDLSFAPDGASLAVLGSNGTLHMWRVDR